MKKQNRNTYVLVIVLILSFNTILQAQSLEDALGFAETVNDVPEAPIHVLIPIALGIGAFLGIRKLK